MTQLTQLVLTNPFTTAYNDGPGDLISATFVRSVTTSHGRMRLEIVIMRPQINLRWSVRCNGRIYGRTCDLVEFGDTAQEALAAMERSVATWMESIGEREKVTE